MYMEKKVFFNLFTVMTQNSALDNSIRPDDLMSELDIKKDAYYKDLKCLNIKPAKDSEGKSYLTIEQADTIRSLRKHIKETGSRSGFVINSIVKVDDSNELVSNSSEAENDIYVNAEEPTAKINSDIIREAQELAARGMAMNDLIKIQLASQMSFDDLSSDLQEKVSIAREVANPKFQPAEIASQLLNQHRQQKAEAQAQG